MLHFIKQSDKKSKDGHIKWVCRCDCGDVNEYIATRVRLKRATRCKKCSSKATGEKVKTHGQKNTKTYVSWGSMKDRCLNQKSKDYPKYGGSGITIQKEWIDSFEAFYLDMGERPRGTSIDRIDTKKGYCKENCRWATNLEQQKNRSNCYVWHIKGLKFETAQEAAEHFNVTKQTITKWVDGFLDARINKFWSSRDDCWKISRY